MSYYGNLRNNPYFQNARNYANTLGYGNQFDRFAQKSSR